MKIDWQKEKLNLIKMDADQNSMVQIANHYGVTKQCIGQVFSRLDIVPICWNEKKRAKREAYQHKWGVHEQEYYQEKRARYRTKKYNAKKAGHIFSIPFSEIQWPTHCPILGIELDYGAEKIGDRCVSFDRYDNTKGYISGNVVIMSLRANRLKADGSMEEHKKVIEWLTNML